MNWAGETTTTKQNKGKTHGIKGERTEALGKTMTKMALNSPQPD